MAQQWFDVSRAGLGKQAEEHGKGRLIGELVQNALDEAGVTQIAVSLALVPGRPLADLTVEDDAPTNNFAACYGSRRLDFNLLRLGHRWFEQGASEDVDALLIHEFGHNASGDHLSSDYHEALCKLGAGLEAGAGKAGGDEVFPPLIDAGYDSPALGNGPGERGTAPQIAPLYSDEALSHR